MILRRLKYEFPASQPASQPARSAFIRFKPFKRGFFAVNSHGCTFQAIHSCSVLVRFKTFIPFSLSSGSPLAVSPPGCAFQAFIPFNRSSSTSHSVQCFIRILVKILHADWGFQAGFPRHQSARLFMLSHSFLSVFHSGHRQDSAH